MRLPGATPATLAACSDVRVYVSGYLTKVHRPENQVVLIHVPEPLEGDRNREYSPHVHPVVDGIAALVSAGQRSTVKIVTCFEFWLKITTVELRVCVHNAMVVFTTYAFEIMCRLQRTAFIIIYSGHNRNVFKIHSKHLGLNHLVSNHSLVTGGNCSVLGIFIITIIIVQR